VHGPIELNRTPPVFAGLDPAIHAALSICGQSAWMRGASQIKPAHDEEKNAST
jgi:hypothetical protein